MAAESGNPEAIRVLVDAGAVVDAKGVEGATPLVFITSPGGKNLEDWRGTVGLSSDARVVDEAASAAFLRALERYIANPTALLL